MSLLGPTRHINCGFCGEENNTSSHSLTSFYFGPRTLSMTDIS